MVAQAGSGTNYFNLWLKAVGYSVVDINILPTAGNAVSIVSAFVFGMIADATGQRLPIVIAVQLLVMISNILLSVWYLPKGVILFANYLAYTGSAAQPIVIVSAAQILQFGRLLLIISFCRRGEMSLTVQIQISSSCWYVIDNSYRLFPVCLGNCISLNRLWKGVSLLNFCCK